MQSIDPDPPAKVRGQWAFLACAAAVGLYGPQFVTAFRPAPGQFLDFVQEWLSARNFWTSHPVYEPQSASIRRHTGEPIDMAALPWNAHPPAAVLVALPAGLIPEYRTAHLVWNLATFPGFVLALAVVARELRVHVTTDVVLLAVALTVTCYPVVIQVGQGQLNFVLLPLLALGWAADRRGCQGRTGLFLGLAAGLKLFPGLVFVYLLFAGKWRAVAVGVAAAIALNAAAWVALGTDAFVTYVREVLPSLSVFRASWRNVSATGFWSRLLGPDGLALASQLAVAAVVAWLGWRARDRSPDAADRGFAAAVVGMLLASPLAWTHSFVLLLVPLALLYARLSAGWQRYALCAITPAFWVPENFFAVLALGRDRATTLVNAHEVAVGPGANLLGLSAFTYALVGLFLLAAFGRWTPATRAG